MGLGVLQMFGECSWVRAVADAVRIVTVGSGLLQMIMGQCSRSLDCRK